VNLDDLMRALAQEIAAEIVRCRADDIAAEIKRRGLRALPSSDKTVESRLVISVAKLHRGERFVLADIIMVAKHDGDLRNDLDARAALAATLAHLIEEFSPIPKDGRVEFSLDGRVSRFGGDRITDDIAIDMAEELLGVPSSRPKQ
jgi:hypothetical protein